VKLKPTHAVDRVSTCDVPAGADASPDSLRPVGFRTPRPGPEADLISSFLSSIPLVHAPDSKVTILREPKLDTGLPDLVLVVWREQRARRWPPERLHLTNQDLRALHFLHQKRRAEEGELARVIGGRNFDSVAARLLAADVAFQRGAFWLPRSRRVSFASTKIIAIEAKVHGWRAVLRQARANCWFASKSYVLVPRASDAQLLEASELGIGVVTASESGVIEWPAVQRPLPRSYASWVLNDLAWRVHVEDRPDQASGKRGT